MDGILLQDWVSLALGSAIAPPTITQGAECWFDAKALNDAVFFLDVKSADSGITINYQTAPQREDCNRPATAKDPTQVLACSLGP